MDLRDEIAKVAYYLFEKCGGVHGLHEEHWFEAERAVMDRVEKSARKNKSIKAAAAKSLMTSKPQKRAIWPQDKPAAEGKKTTRARREKTKSEARP